MVPHGVSSEFRPPHVDKRPLPGWVPQSGYFLYVSSFDVYKAHLQVIRAYVASGQAELPVEMVSVEQIFARLVDRFSLLTTGSRTAPTGPPPDPRP